MTATPLGLRSLSLSDRYRSDQEDVVANFFVPAFTVASSYSRAVGYFTSTSLALYARGIETFAVRGGTMRLIASPHLNEDDVIDIERGYDVREVIERATLRELELESPDTVLDGLGMLGRLIAEGRLDIKLAFVEQEGRVGIYHEKIGIFRDDLGDLVGFTGSSNESRSIGAGWLAMARAPSVWRATSRHCGPTRPHTSRSSASRMWPVSASSSSVASDRAGRCPAETMPSLPHH